MVRIANFNSFVNNSLYIYYIYKKTNIFKTIKCNYDNFELKRFYVL